MIFNEYYLIERNGIFYRIELFYCDDEPSDCRTRPRVHAEARKIGSNMLASFTIVEMRPPEAQPFKFVSPALSEEWNTKNRVYTVRWTTDPILWHDGYNDLTSRGGKAILTLFGQNTPLSYPIAEVPFDAGSYVWTIPYDSKLGGVTSSPIMSYGRTIEFLPQHIEKGVLFNSCPLCFAGTEKGPKKPDEDIWKHIG